MTIIYLIVAILLLVFLITPTHMNTPYHNCKDYFSNLSYGGYNLIFNDDVYSPYFETIKYKGNDLIIPDSQAFI